jgi:hypothetical protein
MRYLRTAEDSRNEMRYLRIVKSSRDEILKISYGQKR